MLQDIIHPPLGQLSTDDVSSPLSAQILELCDPEFLETLQNSEGTSSCEDNSNNNVSVQLDLDKFNCNNITTATNSTVSTTTSTNTMVEANPNATTDNFSLLFDEQDELDDELSASIDFSPSPSFSIPNFMTNQQDQQFDIYSHQPQLPMTNAVPDGLATEYSIAKSVANPMMGPPFASIFEDDCLSSVPSYVPLNPLSPSSSVIGTNMNSFMPGGSSNSAENCGIFGGGSMLFGSNLQPLEMDFQGDKGGIFCPDSISRAFSPSELQGINNENQQLMNSVGNSVTPIAPDISSLVKVGKLSAEERREKIHKYMKKRTQRNFSKKIKYACRKTLADSRPRVRGRFAKNDDFGDTKRAACIKHDEYDECDYKAVKEEEQMVDSADIFAHISGVNAFSCNYSIQSLI